jgi:hypothetical protein
MDTPELLGPKGRLLAVDDEKGSFGDLALRLVRLGFDVLFAAEADEAELLARQEGEILCGALLPSTASEQRVADLVEAIGPHTGIGPESIALLGTRVDEDRIERLKALGLRWHLCSPYEDRDLRYLCWSLVWYGSDLSLRLDRRLPTALQCVATRRDDSRDVVVGDFSSSGAFLEMEHPFPSGSMLELEIALPSGTIELRAMVRWVPPTQGGPVCKRARGCGVEFTGHSRAVMALLEEQVAAERARFIL